MICQEENNKKFDKGVRKKQPRQGKQGYRNLKERWKRCKDKQD